MKINHYFKRKVLYYKAIKGHFNQNFKVYTTSGVFHLKLFRNETYEIKKWISGTVVQFWDEATIQKVCQALIKLHHSKNLWPPMDYNGASINDTKYLRLTTKYKHEQLVPSHNDLNKDNIIITSQKAHFIDFEFKRLNNKHWDVANIINEDNLGKEAVALFLHYYPDLNASTLNDFIYINKTFNRAWKAKHMFFKNR